MTALFRMQVRKKRLLQRLVMPLAAVGRVRILLPALLCGAGLCDGNQGLEPIWKGPKPDWVRVVAQPEGTRTVLKVDWAPAAGSSKYLTVTGKMVSADETSIELMLSPGVSRTFNRDRVAVVRVRRPILKRLSGYLATAGAYLGIYVLSPAVRGRELDLNSRGHALVNLGIAAPIAAGGFLMLNRTRVIYKRDPSK